MLWRAQAEQERQKQAQMSEAEQQRAEREKRRAEKREQRRQGVATNAASASVSAPMAITNKQMKLMSLALILKLMNQDKVTTILNKFDANDSKAI